MSLPVAENFIGEEAENESPVDPVQVLRDGLDLLVEAWDKCKDDRLTEELITAIHCVERHPLRFLSNLLAEQDEKKAADQEMGNDAADQDEVNDP